MTASSARQLTFVTLSVLRAGGPATASTRLLASGNSTPWRPYKNSKPLVLQSLPVISTPNEPSETSKLLRTRRARARSFCHGAAVFPPCRTLRQMHDQLSLPSHPDTERLDQATWWIFSAVLGATIPFWRHSYHSLWPLCRGQRLAGIPPSFHSAGTLHRFLVGASPQTERGNWHSNRRRT